MSFDALLLPIPGEASCGPDLSLSIEFDAIRELQREDDASLDQGDWVLPLKSADWEAVRQRCEALLIGQTKDLRLAAWWMEASAHLDGPRGLAKGLALTLALLQAHWQGLHPQLEEDDAEERVGALAWLLGRVATLAGTAPVLRIGRMAMGLAALDQARQRRDNPAPAPVEDEALQWPQLLRRLQDAGQAGIDVHEQALRRAQHDLDLLDTELDLRLGAQAPSLAAAKQALAQAADWLQRIARDAGYAAQHEERESALPTSALQAQPAAVPHGALQSREQALQQLRSVALFFRRTEPHSPVAYLADKAVRWAEMPLHAWLRQVVKDAGTLDRLDDLLGVDPPASP